MFDVGKGKALLALMVVVVGICRWLQTPRVCNDVLCASQATFQTTDEKQITHSTQLVVKTFESTTLSDDWEGDQSAVKDFRRICSRGREGSDVTTTLRLLFPHVRLS